MANYTVTYSCGHSAQRQLYGKHTDRERFVAWAAREGVCPDCQAANAEAARDAVEAENNLPALAGTDKQVAWARSLRTNLVGKINTHLDGFAARVPADKRHLYDEHCAAVRQQLMSKTDARWWIDNRDRSERELVENLYREGRA